MSSSEADAGGASMSLSTGMASSNTMNKKRKTPDDVGAAALLERKRSISRKSSQRNREKQRNLLESLQTKQRLFNQKNRALKKDNEKLKEHIALIKRFGVHGMPPGQLQAARKAVATDPTHLHGTTTASTASTGGITGQGSASGGTTTSNLSSNMNTSGVASSAANALLSLDGTTSMDPTTAAASASSASRRALAMTSLLMAGGGGGAAVPDAAMSAATLGGLGSLLQAQRQQHTPLHEQLALLQNLSGPASALNLLHQYNQPFLSSAYHSRGSAAALGSNILPGLSATEGDANRLLLMQSILSQSQSQQTPSSSSTAQAGDASAATAAASRSRSADPPGNRAANQYVS